jgi:hypothetical protein
MPEKTHIDEKGNLKVSYWTALGFLERIYESLPNDDDKKGWLKDMDLPGMKPHLPSNRRWHSIKSNV